MQVLPALLLAMLASVCHSAPQYRVSNTFDANTLGAGNSGSNNFRTHQISFDNQPLGRTGSPGRVFSQVDSDPGFSPSTARGTFGHQGQQSGIYSQVDSDPGLSPSTARGTFGHQGHQGQQGQQGGIYSQVESDPSFSPSTSGDTFNQQAEDFHRFHSDRWVNEANDLFARINHDLEDHVSRIEDFAVPEGSNVPEGSDNPGRRVGSGRAGVNCFSHYSSTRITTINGVTTREVIQEPANSRCN